MRRALQYNAITGRMIAVHCEEQSLTRGGHAHAGAGRGRARSRRLAVARREPDGRARHRSRRRHRPARAPDAPLGARVGRASPARARGRHPRERRSDTASSLPHRRGGAHARPEREDEPAAAQRGGSRRAHRGGAGTARSPRSRPITRRTRPRRRTCRSRRRRSASPGSRRRSPCCTRSSSSPACCPLETVLQRMSAGPAAIFGLDRPRIAVGAPANLTLIDLERDLAREAVGASARARPTRGCSASACAAASS